MSNPLKESTSATTNMKHITESSVTTQQQQCSFEETVDGVFRLILSQMTTTSNIVSGIITENGIHPSSKHTIPDGQPEKRMKKCSQKCKESKKILIDETKRLQRHRQTLYNVFCTVEKRRNQLQEDIEYRKIMTNERLQIIQREVIGLNETMEIMKSILFDVDIRLVYLSCAPHCLDSFSSYLNGRIKELNTCMAYSKWITHDVGHIMNTYKRDYETITGGKPQLKRLNEINTKSIDIGVYIQLYLTHSVHGISSLFPLHPPSSSSSVIVDSFQCPEEIREKYQYLTVDGEMINLPSKRLEFTTTLRNVLKRPSLSINDDSDDITEEELSVYSLLSIIFAFMSISFRSKHTIRNNKLTQSVVKYNMYLESLCDEFNSVLVSSVDGHDKGNIESSSVVVVVQPKKKKRKKLSHHDETPLYIVAELTKIVGRFWNDMGSDNLAVEKKNSNKRRRKKSKSSRCATRPSTSHENPFFHANSSDVYFRDVYTPHKQMRIKSLHRYINPNKMLRRMCTQSGITSIIPREIPENLFRLHEIIDMESSPLNDGKLGEYMSATKDYMEEIKRKSTSSSSSVGNAKTRAKIDDVSEFIDHVSKELTDYNPFHRWIEDENEKREHNRHSVSSSSSSLLNRRKRLLSSLDGNTKAGPHDITTNVMQRKERSLFNVSLNSSSECEKLPTKQQLLCIK